MEKGPQQHGGILPEYNPGNKTETFNERLRLQKPLMLEAARQNKNNTGLTEQELKKVAVPQWFGPGDAYDPNTHASRFGAFMEDPAHIDKVHDISTPEAVAKLWEEVKNYQKQTSDTLH
jgi:hypothetical protein